MIQTQKYLFFRRVNKQAVLREKKVPRTLFEVRGVAGSAKYLQSKMSVKGQSVHSVYSVQKIKQVCLFSLFRHANISHRIFNFFSNTL